ncbi:aldose 1-epimerase [Seonamhaeicola sediminis]|uniref:Aldose 1-epimerase n=1 Tax=Seonamhaeicola sediminis TaxID=2528206 RepID=A0A562YF22_9FLAO|nr:aldose 1-epimerase [Seonamhaeicola sediminis]TWO33188.1 aldose 1-epimerase [Seonamhaeicola sediminis]
MYTIKNDQKLGVLEIKNADTYAKIYLNKGASLQELTLNDHEIIKDLSPLSYADTYASSILFPFANRIKDGKYTFEGEDFQFEPNQKEENNALHGLVYNKTFEVIDISSSENEASLTLEYNEANKYIGFPYTYSIQLKYIFRKENLELNIKVKNTDVKTFPFTLGWHPYFTSDNLFESSLQFDSTEKVILGDRNITIGTDNIDTTETFKIAGQQFDDCWILNSDQIIFRTPEYDLKFNATGNNNFLQVYTPPKENTIAIEPTTGISDSFNNGIGLETLKPGDSYSLTWSLHINSN